MRRDIPRVNDGVLMTQLGHASCFVCEVGLVVPGKKVRFVVVGDCL